MNKACDTLRADLSAYLDGELGAEDRQLIEAHLEGCAECRRVLDEWRRVGSALAALCAVPSAAGSLPERVLARVRREEPAREAVLPWFALPAVRWAAVLMAVVCGVVAAWLALPSGPDGGTDVAGDPGHLEAVPEVPAASRPPVASPVRPAEGPVENEVAELAEAASPPEPTSRDALAYGATAVFKSGPVRESDRLGRDIDDGAGSAESLGRLAGMARERMPEQRNEDALLLRAEGRSAKDDLDARLEGDYAGIGLARSLDPAELARELAEEDTKAVVEVPNGPVAGRATADLALLSDRRGDEPLRIQGKGGLAPPGRPDAVPARQQVVDRAELQPDSMAQQHYEVREGAAVRGVETQIGQATMQPPTNLGYQIATAQQGSRPATQPAAPGAVERPLGTMYFYSDAQAQRVGRLRFVAIDADWAVNYSETVARELDGEILPGAADACPSETGAAFQVVFSAGNVERFVHALGANNVRVVDWESPEDPVVEDMLADGFLPVEAEPFSASASEASVSEAAASGFPASQAAAGGTLGLDPAGGAAQVRWAAGAALTPGLASGDPVSAPAGGIGGAYSAYDALGRPALSTYCVEIEGVGDPAPAAVSID